MDPSILKTERPPVTSPQLGLDLSPRTISRAARSRVSGFVLWHELAGLKMGRARQLCPRTSDLNFLCDLKSIINLDAQIPNGALNFVVA